MALREGTRYELRAGVGNVADSMVRMGDVPVLEAGDLLVAAPESSTIEAAGTTIVVDGGAAQVSRALGMSVAAYDAVVHLDSAGQERSVPGVALDERSGPGPPPQAPRPLAYDDQDPWDRRFLGDAIALGDRLGGTGHRLHPNNLRDGEGRTPGVLPTRPAGSRCDEPAFGSDLIDITRPPGQTLIGAAIADLGRRGEFVERWESVFRFKDEGAHWGLVALDQDVSGTPLLGAIEQAVGSLAPRLRGVRPRCSPSTLPPTPPGGGEPPTSTTTSPPPTNPPTTAPRPPGRRRSRTPPDLRTLPPWSHPGARTRRGPPSTLGLVTGPRQRPPRAAEPASGG